VRLVDRDPCEISGQPLHAGHHDAIDDDVPAQDDAYSRWDHVNGALSGFDPPRKLQMPLVCCSRRRTFHCLCTLDTIQILCSRA